MYYSYKWLFYSKTLISNKTKKYSDIQWRLKSFFRSRSCEIPNVQKMYNILMEFYSWRD